VISRRAILLLCAGLLCPVLLRAQASLVPSDHPVYEWLARQRALGNAPGYSYESLPLTRGQIAALLASLHGLSGIDSALRKTYYIEFTPDTAYLRHPNTLLQGHDSGVGKTIAQKARLLVSEREPALAAWGDSSTNVTVNYRWGLGWVSAHDGLTRIKDAYGDGGFRAYATVERHLGFHLQWNNPYNAEGLQYDPQYGKTGDVVAGHGSAFFAQGFASWNRGPFEMDLGTGTLRMGLGAREAVIFRQFSPNFTWVRLQFTSKVVQYTFVHGSLEAPTNDVILPGGIISRVAPARWIAARRFQIRPDRRLQLAFTETVTYSNRGIDISYLNPVYPLKLSEFDNGDRDDPIWFADGVIRPVRGLELYATLGIDDMFSWKDVFRATGHRSNNDGTTKLLYQGGVSAAVRTGTDVRAEYLRVEPYFYTHWLQLNTYQERGFALANDVGPNADEWWLSLKQWVPWRGWVQGSVRFVRQGLNPVNLAGQTIDVGGDLITSRHTGQKVLFLAGDLQKWRALGLDVGLEPRPGIQTRVTYEKRTATLGSRVPNRSVLRLSLSLSFYPFTFLLRPLGL